PPRAGRGRRRPAPPLRSRLSRARPRRAGPPQLFATGAPATTSTIAPSLAWTVRRGCRGAEAGGDGPLGWRANHRNRADPIKGGSRGLVVTSTREHAPES